MLSELRQRAGLPPLLSRSPTRHDWIVALSDRATRQRLETAFSQNLDSRLKNIDAVNIITIPSVGSNLSSHSCNLSDRIISLFMCCPFGQVSLSKQSSKSIFDAVTKPLTAIAVIPLSPARTPTLAESTCLVGR